VRRYLLLSTLLLAALLLCGCDRLARATATPVAAMPTPTDAPLPEATPTFDLAKPLTPTPEEAYVPPEATPTDTEAPPEPKATPIPTEPPVVEPTPLAKETPSPVDEVDSVAPPPPVLDAESVALAQRAQRDGDFAQAESLWRAIAAQGGLVSVEVAEVGLARALVAEGELSTAQELLTGTVAREEDPNARAQAYALLADIAEEGAEWQQQIEALTRYLSLDDHAEPYARWRMALAYERLDDPAQAVAQVEAIDLLSLPVSTQAEMLEYLAEWHQALEQYDAALADYREILAISKYASYRALIMQKSGATLRLAGDESAAVAKLGEVLADYPESYAAYLALRDLDELGAADIGDLQRAAIYQAVRQHEEAVATLERALTRAARADMPYVYLALGDSYAALGDYQEAFSAYDVLIRLYQDHAIIGDAWMAKAAAARANGGDPSGFYQEFVRLYPDHERAPEALMRAGDYAQSAGRWNQASEMYARLIESYSTSSEAEEARFRAALSAYAQNELPSALELWHLALDETSDSEERARLMTFIGLALVRSGRRDQAQGYWQSASDLAPDSYYGRRARDLALDQRPVFSADVPTDLALERLTATDWEDLEAWVTGWSGKTEADLSQDPLALRARALSGIDWRRETLEVLEQMREAYSDDPARLLATVRLCDDLGADYATIASATSLLAASNEAGGSVAPTALRKLLYPTAYGHLVRDEAETYAIDPLYLLAVIRQESRFNPDARSYAGARGLGQVMPDTGEWIATKVGPDDYDHDDLWRPIISIRYEAWFMGWLLDQYRRDWFAALVAYNAGPGNLSEWTLGEPISDHDLFYELIPAQQAQDYVRLIYQQYGRYQGIYR